MKRRKQVLSAELSQVRNGDKLSDIHIVAAQNLIHEEFLELHGLQSPLLSQVDGFIPVMTSGMQINHLKDHWVTSSCFGGEVHVYINAFNGKLSVDLTHQLAALYKLQVYR